MEQPTSTQPQSVPQSAPATQPVAKPETIVSNPGNGQSQLWIYVMIVIILVMLAAGGYFLYQSMQLNKPTTPTEQTQSSPAPSQIPAASNQESTKDPGVELDSLTIEDPSTSFGDIDKDLNSI